MQKAKIEKLIQYFSQKYPDPKPSLNFSNNFTFLVAVILSAQCTDERVNKTTPLLFPKYDSPDKLLDFGEDNLKKVIKPCGFFNVKAKNIIELSKILIEKYAKEVPRTMEDLTSLPGVGRKTASVILSQAFHLPAVPVDTHVFRVTNRLGLANAKTAFEVEKQVSAKINKKYWNTLHLQLIFHGRQICTARKPKCYECPLCDICRWQKKKDFLKNN